MILTIICPESKKHKTALTKAMNHVGITDYQILDPAHDEIAKEFSLVLYVGKIETDRLVTLHRISQKAWDILPPDPTAPIEAKKNWLNYLKEVQTWILDNKDKEYFKKGDAPDIMQLENYLNSKIGQVVQIKLPDRRKLGIYPDGQRLLGENDIEYHASTVVNIAKLFSLFDASEIVIKEL